MKKYFMTNRKNPPKQHRGTFICSERGNHKPSPEMKGGAGDMSDQHTASKQHAYDCYVKKTLRNELRTCWREKQRRFSNEVTFSDLPESTVAAMGCCDRYICEYSTFWADGCKIYIENECLAEALQLLSETDRNIMLMYDFLNMTDYEIAARLNMSRRTVNDRRHGTYRILRKLMGGDQNETL